MASLFESNYTTPASLSGPFQGTTSYTKILFFIISISILVRVLFIGTNDLLVEEAYYWNYAKHLDFSYLDHPPMVALLIKMSTAIFGTHELGVRISALFCWLLMAFFSFKLTACLVRGAGIYALLLLSILPYFFIQSVVITPDLPLVVCWSGALYCLYWALVLEKPSYWYAAGLWIGLGMLSKYTICLLGLATLFYVVLVPSARFWLRRKEPYVSALIATILFTPVIYWNANHQWVSFLFQSTRRMNDVHRFSFHYFLGVLLLFLMPLGVLGVWGLFREKVTQSTGIGLKSLRFLQIYLIVPLAVFGLFSMTHSLKLTWIGPCLLAAIPWLSTLLHQNAQNINPRLLKTWLVAGVVFLVVYSGILFTIVFGMPATVCKLWFNNFFDWNDFTAQVYSIAHDVEKKTDAPPLIIPLDTYNIASEFIFYQELLLAKGSIPKQFQVEGQHYFGESSLMYKYWSKNEDLAGRVVLLLARDPQNFESPALQEKSTIESPVQVFWAHSQGKGDNIRPYYYQVVKMK